MNQKYFAGFYLNEMGEEICLCFDVTAENLASFLGVVVTTIAVGIFVASYFWGRKIIDIR